MEQKVYDMIVVGGGPAGYTAALYGARANLSVLLLEKLTPGGQMGTTDVIDNYPGFPQGVGGFELALKMAEGAERFGVETQLDEVTKVSLSGEIKEVQAGNKTYLGKTVVLSTGAHPKEVGIPGEQQLRGKGVSYCATCDGMFYRNKTVAVIGGGNTAAADVLYLAKLCKKVYLVHRRDQLRASKVYLEPLQKAENVEFVWDSLPEAIAGEDRVESLTVKHKLTGERRTLPVDGVFVAIGTAPNSRLFEGQLTLDAAGYIPADETTKTEIPGVYAVGDLRAKPLRQVVTAASDGAVAAFFAEEYLSLQS